MKSTLTLYTVGYLRKFILCLSIVCLSPPTQGLVLEDLIKTKKLLPLLQNKKVGYYIGSFDPLHKGHEATAKFVVSNNLCDYVIVYPSWGGDNYKQRAATSLRLDMLFAAFKDHPRIIVTRYPPKQLQEALTDTIKDSNIVAPTFKGLKFIGVIGSDIALQLTPDHSSSSTFMSGAFITKEHEYHTWGGCIALPVDSFIVSMRAGDDLSRLNNTVGGRPIVNVTTIKEHESISSSLVKKLIRNKQRVDDFVSQSVLRILEKNRLYHH